MSNGTPFKIPQDVKRRYVPVAILGLDEAHVPSELSELRCPAIQPAASSRVYKYGAIEAWDLSTLST